MNREDLRRDQAKSLRHKTEQQVMNEEREQSSSLPSRSEIHQHKRQKHKWKLKYPIIKLLALFFILLPVVIYSWVTISENQKQKKASSSDSSGYETVGIDDQEKKTSYDIREPEEDANDLEEPANQAEEGTNDHDQSVTVPVQTDQDDHSEQSTEDSNKKEEQPNKDQQGTTQPQKNVNIVYHTVQPNETLYRISMKYYQSQVGIDIIKRANGLQGNDIRVGQVLKIPMNK